MAARLADLQRLGQELRAFADHGFLRKRTPLSVAGPTTSGGAPLVYAALFQDGPGGDSGVAVNAKTVFLCHLYMKTIFLPRQTRDKHMESTQK